MDTQPQIGPRNLEMPEPTVARAACPIPADDGRPYRDNREDTATEWAMLVEAMAQNDAQLIQDWKDDLNNLLVFAGLFSGVVAGFALESYSWLQQDNSDISVQLLAQISSQLGSFSVSEGFINSTVAFTPLASLDPPFRPSELDVRVNVLWFLSLAISLTTSLSAIMVQQWLQAYRLPTFVSTRERIRLRQYRYDALFKWNLNYIISLLPLCLQIALILFLVGLCYLLATVDKTVAKAFISFVGLALSAHFSFAVLPIVFKSCPYKNPVAHAATVFFNVLIACILLAAAILGLLLARLFEYPLRLWSAGGHVKLVTALIMGVVRTLTAMLQYSMTFVSAHTELRGHDFWAGQDLDHLPAAKHLDRDALMAAPSVMPATDHTRLNLCLRDLPDNERISCACFWASQELNVSTTAFTNANFGGRVAFNTTTFAKIDTTFSNRFRHILLASLPDIIACSGEKDRCHETGVLLVLRHIAWTKPADPEWTKNYARRLFNTRDAYSPMEPTEQDHVPPWPRLIQACIFELASIVSYDFSAEEVSKLCDYAINNDRVFKQNRYPIVYYRSLIEVLIASYATPLLAVSRNPTLLEQPSLRTKITQILVGLDETVVGITDEIREEASQPVASLNDGVLLVLASACNSLCTSIVSLARINSLPLGDDLTLSQLVSNLKTTFEGEPFTEGRQVLLDFFETTLPQATPSVSAAPVSTGPPESEADVMASGSEDEKDAAIEDGTTVVTELRES